LALYRDRIVVQPEEPVQVRPQLPFSRKRLSFIPSRNNSPSGVAPLEPASRPEINGRVETPYRLRAETLTKLFAISTKALPSFRNTDRVV